MSRWSISSFLHSPAGGLAIGLFSSFFLASLASAGLNTLAVARILLLACFLVAAGYVCFSDLAGRMTWRRKGLILSLVGVLLFAIERVETWAQPKPPQIPHFPAPPLLLMVRTPTIRLEADTPLTRVPDQSVLVSYLDRPQGGYAGFGSNEEDDAMLGIPDVDIFNPTDEPISLSWALRVTGEGSTFVLNGSGKGRWQRQLNENDFIAETRKETGGRLGWFLSPTTIRPKSRLSFKQLGFVAPNVSPAMKKLIESNGLDHRFTFTLIFTDLGTGARSEVRLPFGALPTRTFSSNLEMLKELAREQGYELNTETGEAKRIGHD